MILDFNSGMLEHLCICMLYYSILLFSVLRILFSLYTDKPIKLMMTFVNLCMEHSTRVFFYI